MLVEDGRSPLRPIAQLLRENYDLRAVKLDEGIAEDVDVLLLMGSQKQLSNEELFAVDQYVMKGGALGLFPLSATPDPTAPMNIFLRALCSPRAAAGYLFPPFGSSSSLPLFPPLSPLHSAVLLLLLFSFPSPLRRPHPFPPSSDPQATPKFILPSVSRRLRRPPPSPYRRPFSSSRTF